MRSTNTGLQQMALAASRLPPDVEAAFAAFARQGIVQHGQQFLIAARDKVFEGRPPVRRDVEQQLTHGLRYMLLDR